MHPSLSPRIAAFAAVVTVVLAIPQASAHAIIVEASPTIGAAVHAGALDVRLRFNSRIDRRRSRVTLLDTAGKETPVKLDDNTAPDEITARIPSVSPGEYRLRWQVLALDGHITRGDIPFSVTAP